MSKNEEQWNIEFNRILKEAYFSLFHEASDIIPPFIFKIPDIESLVKIFEEDLSRFKFESLTDFESFMETILLFSVESIKHLNLTKKQAFAVMHDRLRELAITCIERQLSSMSSTDR